MCSHLQAPYSGCPEEINHHLTFLNAHPRVGGRLMAQHWLGVAQTGFFVENRGPLSPAKQRPF